MTPLVNQRKEASTVKPRIFFVIATLFVMVGTSACSVGFGVQGGPEPVLVPPPVYAYPYPSPYAYRVPAPYYRPYRPGVYAAPPPVVFGFRFGDDRDDWQGRRYNRRWQ
jgi:hypothetical protein